MNTALIIIGLAMFIFIVVFTLKRSKEKRKTQQEEYEKIKEYGEKIKQEVLKQSYKELKKGDNIEQVLEKNTSILINKLMHLPNIKLKKAAEESDIESIQLISKLYGLDDSEK